MKLCKYLVLFRHSGEVFQELYFSNLFNCTNFISELITSNHYDGDGDEVMIQVQYVDRDLLPWEKDDE